MSKIDFLLVVTLLLILTSCGSSGTWEDENENWERAFGLTFPDTIEMKRSWYWRSPHWPLEQEYFFEIECSKNIEKKFLKGDDLELIDSTHYEEIKFFNNKPSWFAPKDYNKYEIWNSSEYDNYYLFIDRTNSSIFITDHQI
jgi:hypothetical protein